MPREYQFIGCAESIVGLKWHLTSKNSDSNKVAATEYIFICFIHIQRILFYSHSLKVEPHINPLDLIVYRNVCVCVLFQINITKDKSNSFAFE